MAFIRKRHSSTKDGEKRYSYQLIETYRENGNNKQRVLANLGPYASIEEALPVYERWLNLRKDKLAEREKHLARGERAMLKHEFVTITAHRYRIKPTGWVNPDSWNTDWNEYRKTFILNLRADVEVGRRYVEKDEMRVQTLRRALNQSAA